MAHHSQQPSPEMIKHFQELMKTEAARQQFGATGLHPEGHLSKEDEGELQFGVSHLQGKVIINFGKPVAWLGLTSEQAEALGYSLIEHATKAKQKNAYKK